MIGFKPFCGLKCLTAFEHRPGFVTQFFSELGPVYMKRFFVACGLGAARY